MVDHQAFMARAEALCHARGCKLTALRRQVLELVLRQSGVVKAYHILAELQQQRGAAAPPTVYRALEFLVEQGLLHRVTALNGYVLCDHLGCQHDSLFLVCAQCGAVQELESAAALASLSQAALTAGFALTAQNLVLNGRCQRCELRSQA